MRYQQKGVKPSRKLVCGGAFGQGGRKRSYLITNLKVAGIKLEESNMRRKRSCTYGGGKNLGQITNVNYKAGGSRGGSNGKGKDIAICKLHRLRR